MSVEVNVLGTCGGYARRGRACSGYLIRSSGSNLLVDIGNGVLSNLQNFINFFDVNAIALSHMHPDHYADIFSIFTAIRFFPVGLEPIPVLAPSGAFDLISPVLSSDARKAFLKVFRWMEWIESAGIEDKGIGSVGEGKSGQGIDSMTTDGHEFRGKAVDEDADKSLEYISAAPVRLSGFDILSARVNHPLEALGFRVEVEDKVIAYSGDSDVCDALVMLARGADLFICEATFTHQIGEKGGGHLFAAEAGRIAERAGVKRLLLTHIWPLFDEGIAAEEAKEEFGGIVEVAREGMRIEV